MNWYGTLPKQIRVGPHTMAVKVINGYAGVDQEGNASGDFGRFVHNTQTIELAEEQPSATFAVDTLLHEINHAIWELFSLQSQDGEERIVSSISAGLVQVLADNPAVVRWIVQSLGQNFYYSEGKE